MQCSAYLYYMHNLQTTIMLVQRISQKSKSDSFRVISLLQLTFNIVNFKRKPTFTHIRLTLGSQLQNTFTNQDVIVLYIGTFAFCV